MAVSVKTKLAAPVVHPDGAAHRRLIAEVLNRVLDGATNAVGSVTLDANTTTTTLSDLRIGPSSTVHLTPETVNAASESGTIFVVPGDKQAVITHTNTADTDKTFRYSVHGS